MARLLPATPKRLRRLRDILNHPGICRGCLSKKVPAVHAFAAGELDELAPDDFRQLQRDIQQVSMQIHRFQENGGLRVLRQLVKDKRIHHRKVFSSKVLTGLTSDAPGEEWREAVAAELERFAEVLGFD